MQSQKRELLAVHLTNKNINGRATLAIANAKMLKCYCDFTSCETINGF